MKHSSENSVKNTRAIPDSTKQNNSFRSVAVNFKSFDQYLLLIPDFNFEDKSKIPKVSYETTLSISKFDFGPKYYLPLSKIIQENFIAIIYSLPVSGDIQTLMTFTKNGKKIDETRIFNYEGIEDSDSPYRKEEKCDYQIDRNLNIHYKHNASLLIKTDKSNSSTKDSVLMDDFEEYYAKFDSLGHIMKVKKANSK